MGYLDFVLHQFVGFLSFDFSKEVSINGDKVHFLVVKLDLFAVMGFLYKALNFNVIVFLEYLPHFLCYKNVVFLLLKSVLEYEIEMT